jgi:hypothetical protein
VNCDPKRIETAEVAQDSRALVTTVVSALTKVCENKRFQVVQNLHLRKTPGRAQAAPNLPEMELSLNPTNPNHP